MSDNEEELFEVENVIDSRTVRGVVQYRVRWSNFSPQHDTWEPEENLLTCHDLIEKYLAEKNSNSNENNNSPAAATGFENGDSNAGSSSSATATEAKYIEETNSSIPSIIETESNLFSNLKANIDAFSTVVDEANTSKASEQSEQELEQPKEGEKGDKTANDKNITSPRRRKRQQRKPRWEIIDVVQETFWKQLEKGQVDLSMGLYERVKRKRQAAEAASAKFVPPKRRVREKKSKPPVFNVSDKEMTDQHTEVIHDLINEQVDENEEASKNDSNISPNSPSKSVKTYSRRSKVKNDKAELKIDELVKAIVQPNIPKSLGKSPDKQSNQNNIDSSIIENGTESNAKSSKNKTVISTANGRSTEEVVDKSVSYNVALYSSRQSDIDFQEKLSKVVEEVICRNVPNENTIILSTSKSEKFDSKQVKEESDVFNKESNGAVHSVETPTTHAIQRDSSEENVADYLAETFVPVISRLNSMEEKIECKSEIYLKTDIPDPTESNLKLEENINSANSSSSVKLLEPSVPSRGRWLPLAPKLVTINHIVPETSLAAAVDNSIEMESLEDSQSPALDDLPPIINTSPSEQPIIDNVNDSDSKHSESKIALPTVVSKRQIDDLAADIEEDLNVNDFFKTDMHKCQEEERQTGRFVTNDMFAEACRLGNFEMVRSALTASKNYKCPYDVEAVDIYGNTLLMSATIHKCDPWHSSDDVIELLAQYGANLNASNRAGETALMLAIEHEHLCKVTKLLSLGAAVNLPNRCGETPLMVASRKGFAMVAHRLLEYGADFNATTTNGRTVTDMASTSKGVMKVLQMHESRVKLAFEQELLTVIEPDKIKLKHTLFPMHCYAINESRTFRIMFNYKPFPFPPKHFTILVVGIAKLGTHVVSVRFWGTSPVVNVLLNDIEQQAVQEDGRFIFTLSPLKSGANELLLKCADNYKMSQCKLLTSAFVVQMM